jgi:hypothetical protein
MSVLAVVETQEIRQPTEASTQSNPAKSSTGPNMCVCVLAQIGAAPSTKLSNEEMTTDIYL